MAAVDRCGEAYGPPGHTTRTVVTPAGEWSNVMDTKTYRSRSAFVVAAALVTVGAFSGVTIHAQGWPGVGGNGLVGTWAVEVTLRDCATNAALGAPFRSLSTYHEGGTLTDDTASLAFAIGQRSAGQGTWAFEGGRRYAQVITALLRFDSPANLPGTPGFDPTKPVTPGFLAGWQVVRHDIELVDRDHWNSQGTNAFYNTAGAVYRTGCSTATAMRVQ